MKEIEEMLNTTIAKSGEKKRMKKISLIADHLREQKEEIGYDYEKSAN